MYAGSPERVDFSEADEQKGFCWVEVAKGATQWRFVPLPARAMVSVDLDLTEQADPTDAALRALERHPVKDAIVRVRLRLRRDQESLLDVRASSKRCAKPALSMWQAFTMSYRPPRALGSVWSVLSSSAQRSCCVATSAAKAKMSNASRR